MHGRADIHEVAAGAKHLVNDSGEAVSGSAHAVIDRPPSLPIAPTAIRHCDELISGARLFVGTIEVVAPSRHEPLRPGRDPPPARPLRGLNFVSKSPIDGEPVPQHQVVDDVGSLLGSEEGLLDAATTPPQRRAIQAILAVASDVITKSPIAAHS
jgi:hypothetical protein